MARYLFRCDVCGTEEDLDYKIGTRPDTVPCTGVSCSGIAHFILIPPGTMTHSYRDGQKRKGFQDMREAAKLNNLSAGLPEGSTERKEIDREISTKLKVDIRKDNAM